MKTLNVCRKMSVPSHRRRSIWGYITQSLRAHKPKQRLKGLKQSQHCGRLPPETTDALCIQEAYLVTRNLFPQDLTSIPALFSLLNQPYHCPTWTVYKPDAHFLHHAVNQPPPPPQLLILPLQVIREPQSWALWAIQQLPTSYLFYTW